MESHLSRFIISFQKHFLGDFAKNTAKKKPIYQKGPLMGLF